MNESAGAPLTPAAVGHVFASFTRPWWIAGGWALDLFLGRTTRPHDDVEVALLRRDQAALRTHLAEWELCYARDRRLHPWPEEETLELPVHELWARPRGHASWTLELLLNEAEADSWVYRRDPRIAFPLSEAGGMTAAGLPALAPEVVLLYKARKPRPKDEADFRAVLPHLGEPRRRRLAAAVALAEPGHPWLASLDGGT